MPSPVCEQRAEVDLGVEGVPLHLPPERRAAHAAHVPRVDDLDVEKVGVERVGHVGAQSLYTGRVHERDEVLAAADRGPPRDVRPHDDAGVDVDRVPVPGVGVRGIGRFVRTGVVALGHGCAPPASGMPAFARSRISTVPASPSTSTRSPDRMVLVPLPVLITQGMPSSRRHDRAVAHHAADVDDDGRRHEEVRRPARVGGVAHEHVARLEHVRVVGIDEHTRDAFRLAATHAERFDVRSSHRRRRAHRPAA